MYGTTSSRRSAARSSTPSNGGERIVENASERVVRLASIPVLTIRSD